MTLGRRGREPAHRPEPDDPRWRFVEVEDLAPQRVTARAHRNARIAPMLAAIPVIALVAVGLGVFGGRKGTPSANGSGPSDSAAALASHLAVLPETTAPPPIVTPTVPCQTRTETAPAAYLDVDGAATPPLFDEMVLGGAEEPDATAPDFGEIPDDRRTEIPSDARAWIGIGEEVCALGWTISLAQNGELSTLGQMRNPARDPLVAQQNRFELPLAQFRGADFSLVARLVYADVIRQHVWPIRILPFDLPAAELLTGHRGIDVVAGCDVQLALRSGYSEQLDPCPDAITGTPSAVAVRPGATLTFDFGDGWLVQASQVACGLIDDASFAETPTHGCVTDERHDARSWTFRAPMDEGVSSLAIAACALQSASGGENQLCGTWYATVEVKR